MDTELLHRQLTFACTLDDLAAFERLIDQFPDLERKNDYGWTLLIMAAFAHSYRVVNKLVERGADVNASNHKGTTVLMYAKTKVTENRNYAFLDYLIGQGADPAARDCDGKTVLDYARQMNDDGLVAYFEATLQNGIPG